MEIKSSSMWIVWKYRFQGLLKSDIWLTGIVFIFLIPFVKLFWLWTKCKARQSINGFNQSFVKHLVVGCWQHVNSILFDLYSSHWGCIQPPQINEEQDMTNHTHSIHWVHTQSTNIPLTLYSMPKINQCLFFLINSFIVVCNISVWHGLTWRRKTGLNNW